LKQVQKWQNCEGLALKYKAWFAMAAGYLLTMHQSGSRWLAFTFPLYFTAGFILKPTAFWIIKRSLSQEPDKRVYINPPLQLRYTWLIHHSGFLWIIALLRSKSSTNSL